MFLDLYIIIFFVMYSATTHFSVFTYVNLFLLQNHVQVANMIFLDSPVGSGFSFSRRYEGYNANDMSWSEHVYKFLIKVR